MRQIDFEHGGIAQNILKAALPMLVAQVLNLLYNIVDRIYIGHMADGGAGRGGALLPHYCHYYGVQQFVRQRRRTVVRHRPRQRG